ncbi:hypothetical protein [Sulfurimonas sp.]|uniref:hypothetical protein n=1 Tax=Sulfurimonas sp. TaxID=2022749 RepID=UPI003D0FB1DA
MINKKLLACIAVTSALFMSGCSMTTSSKTLVNIVDDDPTKLYVKADRDSTSLGFLNIGNVVRKNYKIAMGVAASETIKRGYKYFTIIDPYKYTSLMNEKKPTNLQEFYDMCDQGDDRFHMGVSFRNTIQEGTKCDSIVYAWDDATLTGGTVKHRAVRFVARLSNEKLNDQSLDAQEVLNAEIIKELGSELLEPTE